LEKNRRRGLESRPANYHLFKKNSGFKPLTWWILKVTGEKSYHRLQTGRRRPVENLKCEPKFSIVSLEKELPPAAVLF
jgi:hypothetical protein